MILDAVLILVVWFCTVRTISPTSRTLVGIVLLRILRQGIIYQLWVIRVFVNTRLNLFLKFSKLDVPNRRFDKILDSRVAFKEWLKALCAFKGSVSLKMSVTLCNIAL
jgi:hypothetical protein